MRKITLSLLLALGACMTPRAEQHLGHTMHSEHPAVVVQTNLATEQASTNELAYQLGTAWLLDRKDRTCDFYEAQAYAALLYTRTADEDAKADAQFGLNRTLKELSEYVRGNITPPEGWC